MAPQNPEEQARETIDRLLTAAGWKVVNRVLFNIRVSRGAVLWTMVDE